MSDLERLDQMAQEWQRAAARLAGSPTRAPAATPAADISEPPPSLAGAGADWPVDASASRGEDWLASLSRRIDVIDPDVRGGAARSPVATAPRPVGGAPSSDPDAAPSAAVRPRPCRQRTPSAPSLPWCRARAPTCPPSRRRFAPRPTPRQAPSAGVSPRCAGRLPRAQSTRHRFPRGLPVRVQLSHRSGAQGAWEARLQSGRRRCARTACALSESWARAPPWQALSATRGDVAELDARYTGPGVATFSPECPRP